MQKGQEDGAVLYVRVSTDEQANGSLNLVNQEKRCREYCKQQGWPVMEVFVDPGESARSVERQSSSGCSHIAGRIGVKFATSLYKT
jgi:predicted site-specific integrase-resolvase